jgi:hypothetical protein
MKEKDLKKLIDGLTGSGYELLSFEQSPFSNDSYVVHFAPISDEEAQKKDALLNSRMPEGVKA